MGKSIPGKSHNACRSLKVGIREKCVCVAGAGGSGDGGGGN